MNVNETTSFLRTGRDWLGWQNDTVYRVLNGILITVIAVFLLSTLREGQNWDGDNALYIMHARNIVEDVPYANTGYIYNPKAPIQPASYQAGLPLLLAPVYLLYGLDFEKMKLVLVISFVSFLLIFSRVMRQSLPWGLALAVTATVGLHFQYWRFKDMIFSEFPFMLFCYATVYGVDRLTKTDISYKFWSIIISAIMLALACLTRSIGFVLFPTIFLVGVYQSRRFVNPCLPIIGIAAVIIIVVDFLYPRDIVPYVQFFHRYEQHRVIDILKPVINSYISAVSESVVHWLFVENWLTDSVALGIGFLALVGVIRRVRVHLTIYEAFFSAYILFMLVFPISSDSLRYLLPILPLLLFYAVYGIYSVGSRFGRTWQSVLPAMLCGALLSLHVAQYTKADFGPIPDSVTDPNARELFNTIKTDLPKDAVLLFWKPTILALFTERRAAVWRTHANDDELWQYVNEIGAGYIVNMKTRQSYSYDERFQAFIERNHQSALRLLFSNEWFDLYQIAKAPISHPILGS